MIKRDFVPRSRGYLLTSLGQRTRPLPLGSLHELIGKKQSSFCRSNAGAEQLRSFLIISSILLFPKKFVQSIHSRDGTGH